MWSHEIKKKSDDAIEKKETILLVGNVETSSFHLVPCKENMWNWVAPEMMTTDKSAYPYINFHNV